MIEELGVTIDRVYSVLSFRQKAWLAPSIGVFTELREQAANECEKDCFESTNSAVFGRPLKNVLKQDGHVQT